MKLDRVQPNYQTIAVGHPAKFACESDKQPKWLFNNNELPHGAEPIKRSRTKFYLIILRVASSHAGTYTCHGEDKGDIYFESHGELVVDGGKMTRNLVLE